VTSPVTTGALNSLLRYSKASTDFTVRVLHRLIWPKLDTLIRLGLAQAFFVSGIMKVTHWSATLAAASHDFPVRFMAPVTAAYGGVSVEVVGGALLALGFMTRYAALALLTLSLTSLIAYGPTHSQLCGALLFGWYAIQGAGPFSVDAVLRQGLADSALPVIPRIVVVSEWIRAHITPLYLSLMRAWLALALIVASSPTFIRSSAPLANLVLWLPWELASRIPVPASGIGALLLLGLGTRYLSALAIAAVFADAMMDPRGTDTVYLLVIFAVLVIQGGGRYSLDRAVSIFADKNLRTLMRDPRALEGLPRVVIVGAGFAGVSCADALKDAAVSVTVIDRLNYHLFQPLLYQVATAALSPGDIATPVRQLFRDAFSIRVLLGTVTGVDCRARRITTDANTIPYDYLVIATGATHSYFGKDTWARHAPGLKGVGDALEIRRRILTAFERAEAAGDANERAALLTFLIVGGGPAGVELAGAIAELARFGMAKEFRTFDPARARVIVVQSAPRLLPAFPETLSSIAQRSLEKLGIEVLLNSRADSIDGEGVMVGEKRIAAKTVLWAAGVAASPAAKWLEADADGAGRIRVGPDFSVKGIPDVFAIGDTAAINAWNGQPAPGLAPAAKQAGVYVGRLIKAKIEGRAAPPNFKYRHLGSLATIGRKAAVADFGAIKLWGAPAWWLWGLVHVSFLAGLRNRLSTVINWFWAYLTYGSGIRLITGDVAISDTSLRSSSTR
jgi:NADH dehydrogenase/putative oxidoreductase